MDSAAWIVFGTAALMLRAGLAIYLCGISRAKDAGSSIFRAIAESAIGILVFWAFGAAILGAEYVMRMLPKGTHHYAQFLKPSELGRLLRHAGLELEEVSGLAYNPLSRKAWLSRFTAVNYILCARKPS